MRIHVAEYRHRKYFFCSSECRDTFRQHTQRQQLTELARAGSLFSPRVRWGMA
jgi:hypothetical protein